MSHDGTYSGSVTGSVPTSLLGIINIHSLNVTANATAAASAPDDSCILTLDHGQPATHVSLTLNGAPIINLTGCSIRTNTSLNCNGHDGSVTKGIASGTATDCGSPYSHASTVPDIYKDLAKIITPKCGTSKVGVSWTPGVLPTSAGFISSVSRRELHRVSHLWRLDPVGHRLPDGICPRIRHRHCDRKRQSQCG